jgi:hypothetical protein
MQHSVILTPAPTTPPRSDSNSSHRVLLISDSRIESDGFNKNSEFFRTL